MGKKNGFLRNTSSLVSPSFQKRRNASHSVSNEAKGRFNGTTSINAITSSFGAKLKDNFRGIILSSPLEIKENSVLIKNSNLDPIELMRSILFWDVVAWPETNGIRLGSNEDEKFLQSAEKLIRPSYQVNGEVATALALAATDAFAQLDSRDPGQWAMSDSHNSIIV